MPFTSFTEKITSQIRGGIVHHCTSENIRNVILLSHSGAGKTSLAESLLFNSGAINRLGKADDGTTTSDYEADEIKRKISINLSVLPYQWKDIKVNLIDTPGYTDFVGEVKAGLRVTEGAVIVVCASSGVEVGTEQVWQYADEGNMPCLVFINKIDRENANFFAVLEDIQAKLGSKCVPVQLPIGSQKDFQGIVDLVSRKGYSGNPHTEIEVPAPISGDVDLYREKLIETVVEVDDELISKYLEGESITDDEIYSCIQRATQLRKVIPVFVGCAIMNKAILPLMDAICNYLPSPKYRGAITATNIITNKDESVEQIPESPLSVLVFKTSTDPRAGKLSCFRVYSGAIESNSQVWNTNKNITERVGQLFILRGKTQEAAPQLIAGDIGVVAKLASTSTGDTLSSREHQLKLSPINFPEPIISKAIHPKSRGDLDKMSTALPKICEEDQTLKIERDPDVGEMLLSGMGSTHLEVAADKLTNKFGVDVLLDVPKVPYKETITVPVTAEYKHKKQTGGHGQYGHVYLELEPLQRGTGFEFGERVVGGSVPRNYIPAVEKGVNEARQAGVLAGHPVVDVKVTLYDGSSHPVDSSDMAFKIAGAQALKKGLLQGQPVLLEPIVDLTITIPDNYTGEIIGDLNSKRARVIGMSPAHGMNIIEAQAPLGEILNYATDLKSMTQGRGIFITKPSHYEEMPHTIAQKIISQKSEQ